MTANHNNSVTTAQKDLFQHLLIPTNCYSKHFSILLYFPDTILRLKAFFFSRNLSIGGAQPSFKAQSPTRDVKPFSMSSTRPVDPRGKGSLLIESNPIKHKRVEFTHPDEIDFAEFLIKGGEDASGRKNEQSDERNRGKGGHREGELRQAWLLSKRECT